MFEYYEVVCQERCDKGEADDFYVCFSYYAPEGVSVEEGPEEFYVIMAEGVGEDVEPCTEDPGEDHFFDGRVVIESQEVQDFFEEIFQGVHRDSADCPDEASYEQSVCVSVVGVRMVEEDFDVDEDVCEDEDGEVDIFAADESDKAVRSEMVGCKGHIVIRNCPRTGI